MSDFSIKNDRKNDANLDVFSLFFRSAENAGNTINTMVSEVFCISESIKNYGKIDEKNASEIDHGKSSKNDPKMDPKLEPGTVKNRENRGPRCI